MMMSGGVDLSKLTPAQMSQLSTMVNSMLQQQQIYPPITTAAPSTPAPAPVSTLSPTTAPYLPFVKTAGSRREMYANNKPNDGGGDDDVKGGNWSRATATWYTSYPECCTDKKADQSECEDYSGCKYQGMFAAFDDKKSKSWVEENNIVAFYEAPNSKNRKEWKKKWKNKKLSIRNPKTGKELDVTVVDTCDDDDCNGCCSKNANKNGGFLIDLEKNTARRFFDGKIQDFGAIEWRTI